MPSMNILTKWFFKALDSKNKFVLALLSPILIVGIIRHNHSVGKWRRETRAKDIERRANMPKWEDRPADAEFIGWCYNTNRYIWKTSDSNNFEYLYSPPNYNYHLDPTTDTERPRHDRSV